MLMYHLFYHVNNSKKDYSEIKAFMSLQDALSEAIKLNVCSNVDLIYISKVTVNSIDVEYIKGSNNG